MNKPVKGLLFDLDGVLVNTENNHYISWKSIAEELNLPFDMHFNEHLKGLSRADSLQFILNSGSIELPQERFNSILTLKNSRYLDSIKNLNESNILPGVVGLLSKAKSLNIKLGVGSSSKNARFILERINLTHYFDVIVDGTDVLHPKPNPEVFLTGAKAMGLLPRDIIVFEDALSGVEAATKGGFKVFGVGNIELKKVLGDYLNDLTEFNLLDYA